MKLNYAGSAYALGEPILQAVWAQGIVPKALLAGPSPEAKRYLVDLPIDYVSGSRAKHSRRDPVPSYRKVGRVLIRCKDDRRRSSL